MTHRAPPHPAPISDQPHCRRHCASQDARTHAHASDARTIAVTGWPSVLTNVGVNESIGLSRDMGDTWINVIGNLAAATATVGLARPGGLLFVSLPQDTALLAGTVSGAFVMFLSSPGRWRRLGLCPSLPLVLVYGLQHEPTSDTLVAATMGRGVYTLSNATVHLAAARQQMTVETA